MRKFRVKALSVGGRGNKIYDSGDIVTENNFAPAGKADELVKKGFLEPIEEAGVDLQAEEQRIAQEQAEQSRLAEEKRIADEKAEQERISEEQRIAQEKGATPNTPITDSVQPTAQKAVDIEDVTRKQIIADLTERKVEFDSTASKKDLFEIWQNK